MQIGLQAPTLYCCYICVANSYHFNVFPWLLCVSAVLQDLKSSNPVEVAMALTVICRLIGPEMIPPLLPTVQAKMLHPKLVHILTLGVPTGCLATLL